MKLLKFAFLGVAAAFAPRSPAAAPLAPVAPASTTALNSIKITVRSGESVDSVIMRLRREVNKSGHLRTLRNKRYHEDAREKKKRKLAEARRKMKFARQRKKVWVGRADDRDLPTGAIQPSCLAAYERLSGQSSREAAAS